MKRLFTTAIVICTCLFSVAQLNINQLGNLTYAPQELNDIWGWVDANGTEYALVGVGNGVSIVSLANPANPVEVFFKPGVNSIWRDLKTWNNHVYITTEGGGGLTIIDLSTLPNNANLTTTTFTGTMYPFQTAHNIFIDENGIAYIFGSDYGVGGAIMLDLTQNPMTPVEVGIYDDYYMHDGMVRGDTMYGSHINNGFQSVIDVSNKQNPVMLANWNTPNSFAHNCWVSDDGNYIYTTDEKQYAYVGAYDISDLGNVTETDRYQSNPGTGTIPHNVHFMNNYVITSYYNDGVTIADVSNPNNIIEVGNFDSNLNFAGNDGGGFHGAWGVYPWLPSGNLLVSDIEGGLFVLGANYVRACRVNGTVTDSACGDNLNNVLVEIVSTSYATTTDVSGNYAFGTPISGTYTLQFSKTGYQTKTVAGVLLTNGTSANINVELYSTNTVSASGTISVNSQVLSGATVAFNGVSNNYTFTSNASGNFNKCNVVAGTYDVIVSKWGYSTYCENGIVVDGINTFNYTLEPKYFDGFSTDLGWLVSSTASSGVWERGNPIGTMDNNNVIISPESDAINTDCDSSAYVTGNAGGNYWDDDIDNGTTTLTSPVMDLSNYNKPYLSFYTWFVNNGGNSAPNDYLSISIANGSSTVELVNITTADSMSKWIYHEFDLNNYIQSTANMTVIVMSADDSPGNIVEAGFDVFQVVDSAATTNTGIEIASATLSDNVLLYPNPFTTSFNISVNPLNTIESISVRTVLGKEIKRIISVKSNGVEVDLNVKPGVYFVSVYTTNGLVKTVRLVKK